MRIGPRLPVLLLLLLPVLGGPACTRAERARGMLVISVDTLRADRLGVYGYERPTSPYLDGFAAEGMVFERATATSPWTLPSHMSLLTGLYPHRHGVRVYGHRLAETIPTLPALLEPAGVSSMGLVSSGHLTRQSGFPRDFERFQYIEEWTRRRPDRPRELRNTGPAVTRRGLDWLATMAGAKRPFFLFLHYYDPHSDYEPRARYAQGLVRPYQGPYDGSTAQLSEARTGQRELRPEDVQHLSDLYDAEIRQLDGELGRVFAFLENRGLLGSTLVIVTSDHGEEFAEHGSVLHGRTYFEEVARIPMIVRGPGVPAGRSDALVSLVDVAPTALDWFGVPVPESLQGLPLSNHWQGGAEHEYVIAESDWMNDAPERYRMIRDGRYKLILDTRTGRSRLYDLVGDPGEAHPLDDPERTARLRERLDALVAEAGAHTAEDGARVVEDGGAVAEPLPEEQREGLRALGYVD